MLTGGPRGPPVNNASCGVPRAHRHKGTQRVDNKDIPSLFKDAIFTILPYSNGTESGIPFLSRSLYTPVLISDINELARSTKELDLGISISSQNPIQWKNKIYDTDIEFVDERLTTFEAREILKDEKHDNVDAHAAKILIDNWFDINRDKSI